MGIISFQIVDGQNLNFALPVDWVVDLPRRAKSQARPFAKQGITGLDRFNYVRALEARKDWQGILDLTKRWITEDPKSADAWYAMGEAYGNLGQHENARKAFEQVLRITRAYPGASLNLGLAYLHLNQSENAIGSFNEALSIKPDDDSAWTGLGNAYNRLRQHDKAIQASEQALRIKPDNPYAWYGLGVSYALLGLRDKAREAYQKLRKLNPAMAEQFFNSNVTLLSD